MPESQVVSLEATTTAADTLEVDASKTAVPFDPKIKAKLDQENKSLRTRLKDSETSLGKNLEIAKSLGLNSLEELTDYVENLKAGGKSSGSEAELATLKRTVEQINKQLASEKQEKEQALNKIRTKTRDSALNSALAEAGVLYPKEALKLLGLAAKVEADDVVLLTTSDGDVELTTEALQKVLPPIFFPSSGVNGSGSKSVQTTSSPSLSLEQALGKQSDFEKLKSKGNKNDKWGKH